jgi:predicted DNA-binding transcriptional regulator AlpA
MSIPFTPVVSDKAKQRLDALSQSPEFIDAKGLRSIFGLSRSHGYRLVEAGHIKSVSLRMPGAIKGKRLWVADSVRAYLGSCIVTPKATQTT